MNVFSSLGIQFFRKFHGLKVSPISLIFLLCLTFCDSFHTGINNFMIFWKLKNIEKIQSMITNFQTDNVNIRQ